MKKLVYCILLFCITTANLVAMYILRERVYAQTDKFLYLAGEPVLMKLMTFDSEQIPIVFSKTAYVELVGDTVAQIQIKVELTNGIGNGRLVLPVDLPTGYYRLIAYTQYMRNEGTDVFFEKIITVINTFQSSYFPAEAAPKDDEPKGINMLQTGAGEPDDRYNITTLTGNAHNNSGTVLLQPGKTNYTTREHGELTVNNLPENIHTLSISIARKDEFVPTTQSAKSLFLMNLTKETSAFTGEFIPEYEGHIISGKIIDNLTGKEVVENALLIPALAFPGDGIRFFAGQKNATGDVRFITSGVSETKEIASIVYPENNRYRVDIHSPFVTRYDPVQMPVLHFDTVCYGRLLERSVALQVFRYFSDEQSNQQNLSKPYFNIKPSMTYLLDEYTRFTTMQEVFIEFITGARFRRNGSK